MDYFVFKGVKSTDKSIVLKRYENIFMPKKRVSYTEIQGRHGSIEFDYGTYEDIIMEVEAAVLGDNEYEVIANARAAERWLSERGQLFFWNEPQRFYIGRIVNQVPLTEQVKWGDILLLFRLEPFAYFFKGLNEPIILDDRIPLCEHIQIGKCTGVHKVGGPTTIEVENEGAFPLGPYMKIEGSFKRLIIGNLVINRPLENGVLYIDNENMVIYEKKLGNRINYMPYTSGEWMDLDVGTNKVDIAGDNLNFTLSYLSRERW